MQWSVATGSIITDLIHGWARKSQQSGFSLIPVPHDPFALPITKNSDPVRGPIFVVLVIHSFVSLSLFFLSPPSLLFVCLCLSLFCLSVSISPSLSLSSSLSLYLSLSSFCLSLSLFFLSFYLFLLFVCLCLSLFISLSLFTSSLSFWFYTIHLCPLITKNLDPACGPSLLCW